MREELSNSERERAQWKAKAEALEAEEDQRASLLAEIDRLKGRIRVEIDTVAKLTIERDAIKSDALVGKARTTAVKIIGGLAIGAYKIDIHSDRLDHIGEMVEDLEKALMILKGEINRKSH